MGKKRLKDRRTNIIIGLIMIGLTIILVFIGVKQPSKSPQKMQSIQGDGNVQIMGDSNIVDQRTYVETYIDNRTYVFELSLNSKLLWSFSELERCTEGEYQGKYFKKLTLEAKGNIPIYNPKIYLRFNKPFLKVERRRAGILFNVIERHSSNKDEYSFETAEFKPGQRIQFIIYSDVEFKVLEFTINDKKIFLK